MEHIEARIWEHWYNPFHKIKQSNYVYLSNLSNCLPGKSKISWVKSLLKTTNKVCTSPGIFSGSGLKGSYSNFSFCSIVWFQKISIPPPLRELEIPKGREGQRPRKFRRGGGLYDQLLSRGPLIQYGFECRSSCSKIFSCLLSRSFTWKIVAGVWIFSGTTHFIIMCL